MNSVSLLQLFKIVHNFFYHLCKFVWYLFIIFAYNLKSKTMTNLVSIEKKKFLHNEYVEERDYTSAYDLVMELLDNSYCEQGDIKEMIEICAYCFSNFYASCKYMLQDDVINAHNDWIETNYINK